MFLYEDQFLGWYVGPKVASFKDTRVMVGCDPSATGVSMFSIHQEMRGLRVFLAKHLFFEHECIDIKLYSY